LALKDAVKELQRQLASMQKEIEMGEKVKNKRNEQLKERDSDIKNLMDQYQAMENDNRRLGAELERLSNDYGEENQSLRAALLQSHEDSEKLRNEFDSLRGGSERTMKTYSDELEAVAKDAARHEEKARSLESELEKTMKEASDRLKTTMRERDEAMEVARNAEASRRRKDGDIERLEAEIKELKLTIKKQEDLISDLRKKVRASEDEAQERMSRVVEERNKARNELEEALRSSGSHTMENTALQKELEALRLQLSEAQAKKNEGEKDMKKFYEKGLADAKVAKTLLEDNNQELQDEISMLRTKLVAYKDAGNESSRMLDNMRDDLKEEKIAKRQMQDRIDDLEASLDDEIRGRRKAEEEKDRERQDREQSMMELDARQHESNTLKKQVNFLKERLHELSESLQQAEDQAATKAKQLDSETFERQLTEDRIKILESELVKLRSDLTATKTERDLSVEKIEQLEKEVQRLEDSRKNAEEASYMHRLEAKRSERSLAEQRRLEEEVSNMRSTVETLRSKQFESDKLINSLKASRDEEKLASQHYKESYESLKSQMDNEQTGRKDYDNDVEGRLEALKAELAKERKDRRRAEMLADSLKRREETLLAELNADQEDPETDEVDGIRVAGPRPPSRDEQSLELMDSMHGHSQSALLEELRIERERRLQAEDITAQLARQLKQRNEEYTMLVSNHGSSGYSQPSYGGHSLGHSLAGHGGEAPPDHLILGYEYHRRPVPLHSWVRTRTSTSSFQQPTSFQQTSSYQQTPNYHPDPNPYETWRQRTQQTRDRQPDS